MDSPLALNRAALDEFVGQRVSREMVTHLARQASQVIRCEQVTVSHGQVTPPSTPPLDNLPLLPTIEQFIASLVARSQVQVPTLMSSLVYLGRLRAPKNLNDSSPKNKHWARYTAVKGFDGFGFSMPEVNLMERQLLFLLDWDTRVTEEDLLTHLEPFLEPIRLRLEAREQARKAEEDRQRKQQQHREWRRLHASADLLASRLRRQKADIRSDGRRGSDISTRRLPSHVSCPSMHSAHNSNSSPPNATDPDRFNPYMRHRTSPSRQGRSISPPSIRDVPGLSHAETFNSLCSRSSSLAPSSRGTPASISTCSSHGTDDVMVTDTSSSPASSLSYSYVNVGPLETKQPLCEPTRQPSKKMKPNGHVHGGGFVARFLASATGSYGRIGCPH
ncbi:hypothetical protein N7510_010781 [Penicillium lagena]|uniref:uncharacterized protein n=1 Tax=Penicillium lagena TaxID=94218 RepID=UPI00253FC010|nr:uncharacterized protein N7510_010781 [Penicillium lagena]KAJ5601247.1 hypothetical protein N7510_010781 [Penicillium lagena]